MTRRLCLEWPDAGPFRERGGEPIRIFAISDQLDPALVDRRSREALGRVDLVVGCGDLAPEDLGFVADGVDAPLVYVHGNHDGGARSQADPSDFPSALTSHRELGLAIVGLSWPGVHGHAARPDGFGAWRQVVAAAARASFANPRPLLVVSHVPPGGVGDVPTDAYHRGFPAYRWLMDRLHPPIWLHGHTPLAAVPEWCVESGGTTVVNATGGVLVELGPPIGR